MIPRLPETFPVARLTQDFLKELRAFGFTGEISVTDADRVTFATDNSIYQLPPQAVVFPKDRDDVARVMRLLSREQFQAVTVTARGGGTGTNGQSLTNGVVMDLSRHMNQVLEIDAAGRWVRVQAGVVKDQLNAALKPHGLFFAPELSTSSRATIGGMINTDASGQGSCLYGKTRNHVLELTTVLLDGETWVSRPLDTEALRQVQRRTDRIGAVHRAVDAIERDHAAEIEARFPKLNRCLTGYDLAHIRDKDGRFNLNSVLCGAEGTLAAVVEAKLNVLPIPKCSALLNLRYDSFNAALRDAQTMMAFGTASIETVDSKVLALAQNDIVWEGAREFFPNDDAGPVRGVNLIEFVGDSEDEVEALLTRLTGVLTAEGRIKGRGGFTIARGEAAVRRVWGMRKSAVGLLGNTQGDKRPIAFVEDTAVPPENLADYIEEFRALLDARGLDYGMFGHADAGVLHVRPAIDMKDPAQEPLIREITDAVANLTQKYGGLLWGEHGKGVRSEYSPAFFGSLYPLVQAVKAAFDPRNQLNPGKIATAGEGALLRIDEVPTRGQSDRTVPAAVRAGYDEAMNCNGNGACYDWNPDTAMCPSWKATRERRHSPKGRAMLTKEWLRRLALLNLDPVDEARRLRATPGWRTWGIRLRNTLARGQGEPDFSHEVKEAMDGCLSCKSCVGGCPIKVNVPSFRAKFLELYYARYLRPAKDYLVATLEHLLPTMARIHGLYNGLVGCWAGREGMRRLGLVDSPLLTGIDLRRAIAARGWALATPDALRALSDEERRRSVVVVQDAYTSYFESQLVLDILELLQRLGFRPWLAPYRPNGKALHIHGFLGAFERVARNSAVDLRALAATGVTLVGVDPAMTLTYRDEYVEALGTDAVPNVLLLQEWLVRHAPERPSTQAVVYRMLPHCTEHSTVAGATKDWVTLFARLGLKLDVLSCGCCGMAGTYGHGTKNRESSERIYALSWKRHVEGQQEVGRLLATGYSCRSQVKRFGGVALLHPAQALLAALRD
ncbi:MAG TPA: FAD-binding and (Fe-S)-binding domain-containing protein [Telmatospirillum sp.]|nr:FAD-binding and (Fe-S)-binding domain-containing protein [Telmatospirillum sp.]